MKLSQFVIDIASKMLLDRQLWSDVKMWVKEVNEDDIPNLEKHDKVKKAVLFIFKELSDTIIDVAIKLAVLHLRAGK